MDREEKTDLVDKVGVLGSAGLAKVADLHGFRKSSRVLDGALCRLCIIALEELLVLVERASVVVFLQKCLVASRLLLARLLGSLEIVFEPQMFGHLASFLDFFVLALTTAGVQKPRSLCQSIFFTTDDGVWRKTNA
jgi:hypothetical protein